MWYQPFLDRGLVPEAVVRWAIRRRLGRILRRERQRADRPAFVEDLNSRPIAQHPGRANEQHYEVPPEFFGLVLGPWRKYSCGLWSEGVGSLGRAEEEMLALTCARAGIEDGQRILDLGCGWGSLALYAAERYPGASFLAVSNSASQGEFIRREAERRRLGNLRVETADVNHFKPPHRFDRVVSVEMFEHLKNYGEILSRIRGWLTGEGRLFVHMFVHRELAYHFESHGPDDWMGRHFFTGGTMPSHDLLRAFDRHMEVLEKWRVSGTHYRHTCEAWLRNMDARREEILPILAATYGSDQDRCWWVRWRVFFLACSELFGFAGGEEWFVGHYLLGRRS